MALGVDGLPEDSQIYFTFMATNAATSIWSKTVGEFRTLKDSDGDGVADEHELIAGTDPSSPDSVFRLEITAAAPQHRLIVFPSATDRTYTLLFSSNLLSPNWIILRSNITDQIGTTSLTDTNDTGRGFYRVRARR